MTSIKEKTDGKCNYKCNLKSNSNCNSNCNALNDIFEKVIVMKLILFKVSVMNSVYDWITIGIHSFYSPSLTI